MRKVVLFDVFYRSCSFFTSEYDVNNRYGCTHPKQEETGMENGNERGKCYCYSCPLGMEADDEDIDNPNVNWGDMNPREECLDENGLFVEGEYLSICSDTEASEEEKAALASYDGYLNRYNFQHPI